MGKSDRMKGINLIEKRKQLKIEVQDALLIDDQVVLFVNLLQ
jgi:hypothetical protein